MHPTYRYLYDLVLFTPFYAIWRLKAFDKSHVVSTDYDFKSNEPVQV